MFPESYLGNTIYRSVLGARRGLPCGPLWGPIGASGGPLVSLTGLLGSLLMASRDVLGASQAGDLEMSRSSGPL
eukprot:4643297-Pyramimonas_sp.AAC.1